MFKCPLIPARSKIMMLKQNKGKQNSVWCVCMSAQNTRSFSWLGLEELTTCGALFCRWAERRYWRCILKRDLWNSLSLEIRTGNPAVLLSISLSTYEYSCITARESTRDTPIVTFPHFCFDLERGLWKINLTKWYQLFLKKKNLMFQSHQSFHQHFATDISSPVQASYSTWERSCKGSKGDHEPFLAMQKPFLFLFK